MAQPVHRDSVINGKFLAGTTVLTVVLFSLGLVVGGLYPISDQSTFLGCPAGIVA